MTEDFFKSRNDARFAELIGILTESLEKEAPLPGGFDDNFNHSLCKTAEQKSLDWDELKIRVEIKPEACRGTFFSTLASRSDLDWDKFMEIAKKAPLALDFTSFPHLSAQDDFVGNKDKFKQIAELATDESLISFRNWSGNGRKSCQDAMKIADEVLAERNEAKVEEKIAALQQVRSTASPEEVSDVKQQPELEGQAAK